MRKLGAVLTLLSASTIVSPVRTGSTQTLPANSTRKPVVIELFTSEGCSSCPPADSLLQKLEQQQPVAGAEIIALEEHVDYWNHDGWIDPYSSAEWTQRQVNYGSVFKNEPYTPELIIDGQSNFVGNNAQEAVLEIEKAAHAEKADITISPEPADSKGSHHFNVSVGKLMQSTVGDVAEVWLAVTENGLHSSVSKGENAGRQLTHIATLHSLKKIGVANSNGSPASFQTSTAVKFNPNWNPEEIRVTVFLQEKKSRKIIGAASTAIKS